MNYANVIDASVKAYGDKVALSDGISSLSYVQFGQETQRVANALQALGLNVGDSIAFLAENRLEHVVFLVAAARLGLIYAPIHPAFQGREMSFVIGNSTPRAAFVEEPFLALFRESAEKSAHHIETLVVLGPAVEGTLSFEQFLAGGNLHANTVDLPPEQPLLLTYTSGTTSMPKPVLRSHAAEAWSAENYRKGWSIDSSDKILVTMSLAWVYALCSLTQSGLAAGATVRILPRFHPVKVLEVVQQERITTFAGTVSMYPMLLDVLEKQDFDIGSLTKIFGGAEARNETAIAKTEKRFNQRLFEGYALSECFPAITVCPKVDPDAPAGSLGRPVAPESEVRLVDEHGNDVAVGDVGEAWIRNPGTLLEYYREPGLTAERKTADGWFKTGDLLRQTSDGYYFFAGRHTDLIIRGGTNISPLEIEGILIDHPAIQDVLVTGIPDERKGEEIVAGVVLEAGADVSSDELLEFVRGNLSDYKVPQKIVFLDEIPKGLTGKKNRNALKNLLSASSSS